MTSYIKILQKLDAFCNAHLQIKKFMGEFREQMPNFSTLDERYPVVFATPVSDIEDLNTNQFTIEIYCVDIIQKDRANINTIVSDCHLILKDMFIYYRDDNDLDLDVVGTASISFVNNFDLDYVAGAVMTITFEVAGYGSCEIPMEPITPVTNECEPAILIVKDSDDNILYTLTVDSGDTYTQEISDATAVLKDTSGTVLSTTSILAEGSEDITAPDGHVHIKKENDGTIANVFPRSGQTVNYNVQNNEISVNGTPEFEIHATNDLDIRLRDESNNVVTPISVTHSGNHATIVFPDPVACEPVDLFVGEANVGSFPSGSDIFVKVIQDGLEVIPQDVTVVDDEVSIILDDTVPCADATVNVNGNLFDTVASGGTLNVPVVNEGDSQVGSIIGGEVVIGNSDVFINSVQVGDIVAEDNLSINVTLNGSNSGSWNAGTQTWEVVGVPETYGSARLMKSGITTSFADYDAGYYQRGRSQSFFKLPILKPNPFGHTWRFTGKLGGYYDQDTSQYKLVDGTISTLAGAFPDGIMIDWSTREFDAVQTWALQTFALPSVTWDVARTNCQALTVGGISTWALPETVEYDSLRNWGLVNHFSWLPLNYEIAVWSANTVIGSSTVGIYKTSIQWAGAGKANALKYIPTRWTLLTELGL